MRAVRTAVMMNRFNAIVEEAAATIYRTAHTTFVKLVQDYQIAIATVEGDIFAYPMQSGVNVFIGTPLQATLDFIGIENFKPGDLYITNDPFSTDGLVTHLMDVTIIYPIFVQERLVAFGWAFVHASDIGGAVPGSISPAFTEVFQEGLRIRPMKLFDQGVLREDIKNIFFDNSRIPSEMWGDFQAMISGMRGMDKRISALCDRFGIEEVLTSMHDILDFGERKARAVIEQIPDGTYRFNDYLEGIEENHLSYLAVTMEVEGSSIRLYFAGTDPQLDSAYNFVSGARTHPYLVQALISYLVTRDPTMPRNAGILRSIKVDAPRGTFLNANFPAAGGSRVAAAARAFDTILACLHQAVPEGVAAAGSGMVGIIVASADDPRTGKRRVGVVNPISGGSGGRSGKDGLDGIETRFGALRSVPTEIVEIESVMLVRAIRLLPDSRGAGRWNGGAAMSIELENMGDAATITVRGLNRFQLNPWGVNGGEIGRTGEAIVNPGTDKQASIGKVVVLTMEHGDVLRLNSPSGAGFGDPLDRDVKAIQTEVDAEMLSVDRARDTYGVVFRDGHLVEDETARLRDRLRSERPAEQPAFTLGQERSRQDQVWPPASRKRLAQSASGVAQRDGARMVRDIHRAMLEQQARVEPSDISSLVDQWKARGPLRLGRAAAPCAAES
jgi:N-methylhydantoinase B